MGFTWWLPMLQCLPDGIEVHDAVYSKMVVDVKEIEEQVYEMISFKIVICRG